MAHFCLLLWHGGRDISRRFAPSPFLPRAIKANELRMSFESLKNFVEEKERKYRNTAIIIDKLKEQRSSPQKQIVYLEPDQEDLRDFFKDFNNFNKKWRKVFGYFDQQEQKYLDQIPF